MAPNAGKIRLSPLHLEVADYAPGFDGGIVGGGNDVPVYTTSSSSSRVAIQQQPSAQRRQQQQQQRQQVPAGTHPPVSSDDYWAEEQTETRCGGDDYWAESTAPVVDSDAYWAESTDEERHSTASDLYWAESTEPIIVDVVGDDDDEPEQDAAPPSVVSSNDYWAEQVEDRAVTPNDEYWAEAKGPSLAQAINETAAPLHKQNQRHQVNHKSQDYWAERVESNKNAGGEYWAEGQRLPVKTDASASYWAERRNVPSADDAYWTGKQESTKDMLIEWYTQLSKHNQRRVLQTIAPSSDEYWYAPSECTITKPSNIRGITSNAYWVM